LVEKKFLKAISDYKLIEYGDKILVAFSGGVDSVVLTYLLKKFKNYLGIKHIYLAHLNHLIRGEEAFENEKFCLDFAKRENLQIFTKKINIKELAKRLKKSVEQIGREERYKFFYELMEEYRINKLATGHHLTDLAETMILWFIQGNKKGIKGFKPKDNRIIRPLYYLKKEEIEEYAKEKGLAYHLDKTNFDKKYLRNKVRHDILKLLKEINPNLENSLKTLSYFLNLDEEFINNYKDRLKLDTKNLKEIDLRFFKALHKALQYRILEDWVYFKIGHKLSYKQLETILKLIDSDGYKEISLSKNFKLIKTYFKIYISKIDTVKKVSYSYRLKVGEEIYIKEAGITLKSFRTDSVKDLNLRDEKKLVCFDIDSGDNTFTVRNRKKGDRFLPFGHKTEKKLKDVFIDLKIDRNMRDLIPLLEYKNKILWIVGYKRSNYYLIKPSESLNVVCFEIIENKGGVM